MLTYFYRVSDEKSSSIFQMTAARTSTTEESNSDNENTRRYCNEINDDDGTQSLLESSTSMSKGAPSGPPAARWKRWLSIFVLYVAMVDSSSSKFVAIVLYTNYYNSSNDKLYTDKHCIYILINYYALFTAYSIVMSSLFPYLLQV